MVGDYVVGVGRATVLSSFSIVLHGIDIWLIMRFTYLRVMGVII